MAGWAAGGRRRTRAMRRAAPIGPKRREGAGATGLRHVGTGPEEADAHPVLPRGLTFNAVAHRETTIGTPAAAPRQGSSRLWRRDIVYDGSVEQSGIEPGRLGGTHFVP